VRADAGSDPSAVISPLCGQPVATEACPHRHPPAPAASASQCKCAPGSRKAWLTRGDPQNSGRRTRKGGNGMWAYLVADRRRDGVELRPCKAASTRASRSARSRTSACSAAIWVATSSRRCPTTRPDGRALVSEPTKTPRVPKDSTRPAIFSSRIAAWIVIGATPYSTASALADFKRLPGVSAPASICSRMSSATCR
jgi:hypothetical protein